jgi:hypothetical protein
MRLIMVDCHFVNNYYNMQPKGYTTVAKNCWFESTSANFNGCIVGSSCYSFSAHNCVFMTRYETDAKHCLDRLYALELTNCIVVGHFCLTDNSGIFNHVLALNNYFFTNTKVLNFYYGTGGLFDYNACNLSDWGTHKFVRFGEHNLNNIDPYDNFVDWDNRDFRLQKNSILAGAGQPVLVGSDGQNGQYSGVANIGPYTELPQSTPRQLFIQGG